MKCKSIQVDQPKNVRNTDKGMNEKFTKYKNTKKLFFSEINQ